MTDEAFEQALINLTETMYRVCYAQLSESGPGGRSAGSDEKGMGEAQAAEG